MRAQLHLNIVNINRCYFYVHVDKGGHMLVEKDDNFMEDNIENLQFLRDIVMLSLSPFCFLYVQIFFHFYSVQTFFFLNVPVLYLYRLSFPFCKNIFLWMYQ